MITWVLSGVTPLSLQRARPNSVSSDTMNPEPYICENVCCNPVLLLQPFPDASFGRVPGCLQVPDVHRSSAPTFHSSGFRICLPNFSKRRPSTTRLRRSSNSNLPDEVSLTVHG